MARPALSSRMSSAKLRWESSEEQPPAAAAPHGLLLLLSPF